jgi:hypothetical protein
LFDTMTSVVHGPRKVVEAAEIYPLGPHAMAVFTQERRGMRAAAGRRTTDRPS